jgi:DNA-binding response OmpR family regulator
MKKILLIEDDVDLFALLKYNLENEGFQLVGSHEGNDAIRLCERERPDLILLDIMLPDADGLDLCRRLRNHYQPELRSAPIIFITARAEESDRIVGLEVGASDYIVKPFFVREVIARIRVQLRPAAASAVVEAGGLELDRARRQVRLDGKEISMTATEFRLLQYLMDRSGVVFSREQLLDGVWGKDRMITDRTVDVHVARLRKKLVMDPENPQFICSVRGFGYSFKEPKSRAAFAMRTTGKPHSAMCPRREDIDR